MPTDRELLKAAYEAYSARNIDAVLAFMHPEVDWPNGMEGGRVLGREDLRGYWTRQWAILDPRVEPVRFEHDKSGRIVVGVHQVLRDLSGMTLADQMVRHVYSIQKGLIERMDIVGPNDNL